MVRASKQQSHNAVCKGFIYIIGGWGGKQEQTHSGKGTEMLISSGLQSCFSLLLFSPQEV